MTELFENRKIHNQIPDGNAHARFTLSRLENTERKILNGKMRIGRDFDKTTQRRTHQRDLTTKNAKATKKIQNHSKELRDLRGDQRSPSARKSSRGSSKLQLPNDVTNFRRYFSRSISIFHSRHAKRSSVNENESAFSSSSMMEV